jgi:hypothetical protein
MARRRMVLRHIDPFSVLKFGALANLAVAAIGLVALTIVSRVVLGSGLVDQVCDIASDVGFLACGIDQGAVTRLLALLALLWAVVQTALLVLLAFLHNLVAELTGGITVTMDVDTPSAGRPARATAQGGAPSSAMSAGDASFTAGAGRAAPSASASVPPVVVARPGPAGPDTDTTAVDAVGAIEAVVPPRTVTRRREGGGGLFGDR